MGVQENIKGSVLIVDDSEDIRSLMGLILGSKFDIVEAENGVEALKLIKGREFDVIILDENMPEMGGHECYSILRAESNVTPVIFCTGMPSTQNQKRELTLGAFDYLSKPVDPSNLIHLVQEAYYTKQRLGLKKDKPILKT